MNFGRIVLYLSTVLISAVLYWSGTRDVYAEARETGVVARITPGRRRVLVAIELAIVGTVALLTGVLSARLSHGILAFGTLVLIAGITAFSRFQTSRRHYVALFAPVIALSVLLATNVSAAFDMPFWCVLLTFGTSLALASGLFGLAGEPDDSYDESAATEREEAEARGAVRRPVANHDRGSDLLVDNDWPYAFDSHFVNINDDDWEKKADDGQPVLNRLGKSLCGTAIGYILAASKLEDALTRYESIREEAVAAEQAATTESSGQLFPKWERLQVEYLLLVVRRLKRPQVGLLDLNHLNYGTAVKDVRRQRGNQCSPTALNDGLRERGVFTIEELYGLVRDLRYDQQYASADDDDDDY